MHTILGVGDFPPAAGGPARKHSECAQRISAVPMTSIRLAVGVDHGLCCRRLGPSTRRQLCHACTLYLADRPLVLNKVEPLEWLERMLGCWRAASPSVCCRGEAPWACSRALPRERRSPKAPPRRGRPPLPSMLVRRPGAIGDHRFRAVRRGCQGWALSRRGRIALDAPSGGRASGTHGASGAHVHALASARMRGAGGAGMGCAHGQRARRGWHMDGARPGAATSHGVSPGVIGGPRRARGRRRQCGRHTLHGRHVPWGRVIAWDRHRPQGRHMPCSRLGPYGRRRPRAAAGCSVAAGPGVTAGNGVATGHAGHSHGGATGHKITRGQGPPPGIRVATNHGVVAGHGVAAGHRAAMGHGDAAGLPPAMEPRHRTGSP